MLFQRFLSLTCAHVDGIRHIVYSKKISIPRHDGQDVGDGYYVAYKLIILPCISFMFIEIIFIH